MQITELYDATRFRGVSQKTRTDIIGALGIDIDGLIEKEGGKFTIEQLSQGLQYLLITNQNLHPYIQKSPSSKNDPFYIVDIGDPSVLCFPVHVDFSSGAGDCSGADCGGGDGAELLCLCSIVALAGSCCICTGLNIHSTLKSNESRSVQAVKIIISALVFLTIAVASFKFLPINDADVSGYGLWFRLGIALLIASTLTAITSYLSKSIQCLPKKSTSLEYLKTLNPPKPDEAILAELENVKIFLEKGYSREGDNIIQCQKFIQEVVRYYIYEKSTDKIDIITQPKSPVDTVIEMDEMKPSVESKAPLLSRASCGSSSFFKSPSSPPSVITIEPESNDHRYIPSSLHRSTAL